MPSSAGACQIRKIRAIVRIDKVPTRRVWPVHVDRLHPAKVRLLEEFQYFETVTFETVDLLALAESKAAWIDCPGWTCHVVARAPTVSTAVEPMLRARIAANVNVARSLPDEAENRLHVQKAVMAKMKLAH